MGRPRQFDMDSVLSGAMQAFWQHGYAATSLAELSDCTGLGSGSLYAAFGSKHALFERTLARYLEVNTEADVAVLEDAEDVPAAIEELLVGVVEAHLGDPHARGCLAVNAAIELAGREEAVTEAVRRVFTRVEDALFAALTRGQAAGTVARTANPRAQARYVLNALYGLRVLGTAATDRAPLLDAANLTLANLRP